MRTFLHFILAVFLACGLLVGLVQPGSPPGGNEGRVRSAATISEAKGKTIAVSLAVDGRLGNGDSMHPFISADGRYVVFDSSADNLIPDDAPLCGYPSDPTTCNDVFRRDLWQGTTILVSRASDGTQGNRLSWFPTISADGRYIAFESYATNLGCGGGSLKSQVYVHDVLTGITECVSVNSAGEPGNFGSLRSSISADGRFVAFESYADNLAVGDTNHEADVFVRDRQAHQTRLVSVHPDGTTGDTANDFSSSPSISADGRFVAFYSPADDLVLVDPCDVPCFQGNVYVRDLDSDTTELISINSSGNRLNGWSGRPSISAEGRYVSFTSEATDLIPVDTNQTIDVFLRDRQSTAAELVSVSTSGEQGNLGSDESFISADGRYIAFSSRAANFYGFKGVTIFQNSNIYRRDRQNSITELVSQDYDPLFHPGMSSGFPSISSDGQEIAFGSVYTRLVEGDENGASDVFVFAFQGDGLYSVSGVVKNASGAPVAGVTVVTDEGQLAVTDETGRYELKGLNRQTYILAAHRGGFTFLPPTRSITFQDQLEESADFTAYAPEYAISGQVRSQAGQGIPGVVISDHTGRSVSTNAQGNYTLAGLYAGWYKLTAYRQGYDFDPLYRTLVITSTNLTGQDFTATQGPNIGYQQFADGYSFDNYTAAYPVTPPDFTLDDMVSLFGAPAVCAAQAPACLPRPSALLWAEQVNRALNRGRSDGMASTSLRFFKGLDAPADFQPGAAHTYDLQQESVRRHVAAYFARQMTGPLGAYKSQALQSTPSDVLDQVTTAFAAGAPDPVLLSLNIEGLGGLTLVPFAIDASGDGVYNVSVYDPNHSDDDQRYVSFNVLNNTWSYYTGERVGMVSGDANSHSLGAVPLSQYSLPPACPWCSASQATQQVSEPATGQVWLSGGPDLYIQDSQGRRLGSTRGNFINEIPGAYKLPLGGGLGVETAPVYSIPLSGTLTLMVNGEPLSGTAQAALSQFSPGNAVSIQGIPLDSSSFDLVQLSPDGQQAVFTAGLQPTAARASRQEVQSVSLAFARDGGADSQGYSVQGLEVAVDRPLTLTLHSQDQELVVNNALGPVGSYDLQYQHTSPAGQLTFLHQGIPLDGTDTHTLDFHAFTDHGVVTLSIDTGSTGTVSQVLTLANQARIRLYLPLASRE